MEIYRLETIIEVGGHPRSFGPFTARCYDKSLTTATLKFIDAMPKLMAEPIDDDCGCNPSGNQVCGFYSINHLREFCRWEDTTQTLLNLGFRIAVYDVSENEVIKGYSQAIFPWDEKKLVKTLTYEQMLALYEESVVAEYA